MAAAVASRERSAARFWRENRLFVVVFGLGAVMRLLILRSAWSRTDSDEAAGLLMVARAAHGQLFSFFWGANYGGTTVTWIEAPFVRIFGLDMAIFRISDLVLTAVAVILFRLVAVRIVGRDAGNVAAVILWIFPPTWVFWTTHEYIFWLPGLIFALATALCCLRWNERPTAAGAYPIGLFAGLTFWHYPVFLALIVPGMLAVLWKQLRIHRRRWMVRTVILGPVGALPWVYTNLAYDFVSFHHPLASNMSYPHAARTAATAVFPSALSSGIRNAFIVWDIRHPSHAVFVVIALVSFGGAIVWSAYYARKRNWPAALVGVSLLLWPLVLAAAKVPEDYTSYRYAFVAVPAFVLMAATIATRIRLAIPAVAIAVAITVLSSSTNPWKAAPIWDPQFAAVSRYFHDRGVRNIWAGYWESYPLSVYTDEQILASSVGPIRDPKAYRLALEQRQPYYMVIAGGPLDQQITEYLNGFASGGAPNTTRDVVGSFAIWHFTEPVTPKQMALDGAV